MKHVEKIKTLLERDFNYLETMKVLNNSTIIFWSWGPDEIKAINGFGYSEGRVADRVVMSRGLMFKVNGMKFQGHVLITLDWLDVYVVHFITDEGIKTVRDVYVDMLIEVIDREVEK